VEIAEFIYANLFVLVGNEKVRVAKSVFAPTGSERCLVSQAGFLSLSLCAGIKEVYNSFIEACKSAPIK